MKILLSFIVLINIHVYAENFIRYDVNHTNKFGNLYIQNFNGNIEYINELAEHVIDKITEGSLDLDLSSTQIFLGMIMKPELYQDIPMIKIGNSKIALDIGLLKETKFAKFSDFFRKTDGAYKIFDAVAEASKKEPLEKSKYDKELIKIDERVNVAFMAYQGSILRIYPTPYDKDNKWLAPMDAIKSFPNKESQMVKVSISTYFQKVSEKDWKGANLAIENISKFQKKYMTEKVTLKPIEYYIKSCENNLETCYDLGEMYFEGRRVKQDYNKAKSIFEKSCMSNDEMLDGRGCYGLGHMYHTGQGVDKNISRALGLYEKSCDVGYIKSCLRTANLYRYGEMGMKKDYKMAVQFYGFSCVSENSESCLQLGIMYKEGIGVKKNNFNAVEKYEEACNFGLAKGCTRLAEMYRDGLGVRENIKKAIQLYVMACEKNDGEACGRLGSMYFGSTWIDEDNIKALKYAKKGCELKDNGACFILEQLYDNGLVIKDNTYIDRKKWTKDCQSGNADICYTLGAIYKLGYGVPQSYAKAKEYFGKACDYKLEYGCNAYKTIVLPN